MLLRELITRNRSYRRFYQDIPVDLETLRQLVDLARLSASAANKQPLKYFLVSDPAKNAEVFSCLGWAGYLSNWHGPEQGERPSAYIILLEDTNIGQASDCDHGIAAQSILLGATALGLGGCMIGSVHKEKLGGFLDIPAHCTIRLVIALGKPKEDVVIESVQEDGNIRYWRTEDDRHHVPKRSLDEIIIGQVD
ncbi:MAG: nitroreductase family protein [Candidatus Electrothrix aestuarii]|uniref:Nitroreductase family protein n=1 Tax=Candidatus Electrothrix aestuarii TaxID=3062594 RepID=A0AAU8LSB7_9BACT|nr:nitroreductase family protein [Candidatus Electrothrix aestuarii]